MPKNVKATPHTSDYAKFTAVIKLKDVRMIIGRLLQMKKINL